MDKLIIEGQHQLDGKIMVSGAKNAALPILFACLLTEETCEILNVPTLADIDTTIKLLAMMGAKVDHDKLNHKVNIAVKNLISYEANYDLVRTMRASVLVLGPTLARFGEAKVSLPGGCSIGARPVNLHLEAFEKLGATITLKEGYILAKAKKLKGASIVFDTVSVGATENALMAAVLAEGSTTLFNCAQEPEIVDLANFLIAMGAKIQGAGTPTIQIEGVKKLHGARHSVIADRIEAGTYLIAAAITKGKVYLPNVSKDLLAAVCEKLEKTGCHIKSSNNQGIELVSSGKIHSVELTTMPFPGFPTDMQAQFMALMVFGDGTSIITENIFENRFMHVAELTRLGADITVHQKTAVVKGSQLTKRTISGATLMATDLRASACLVLAGLAAENQTTVRRIYHLDRGYEEMEKKLSQLGAHISRVKEVN